MKRTNRKYSEALKLKAVYEVETGELSGKGAARQYGCDPSSIREWRRKYGNEGWRERLMEAGMKDGDEKKLKQLERELKESQIRVEIYEKMFEMAQKELGLDLKKNFNIELSLNKKSSKALVKSAKRGG